MDEFSPMAFEYSVEPRNEDSLIICFQGKPHPQMPCFLKYLKKRLVQQFGENLVDMVPSYASLFIQYDLLALNLWERRDLLDRAILEAGELFDVEDSFVAKVIQIPVCYDPVFGLDLSRISESRKLSIKQIIHYHSQLIYPVFAVGFTPGFTYLGDVDEAISMDRLSSPRLKVEKGSVGIADRQTGIYPLESPGGWNIVGRTPVTLFDIKAKSPNFLEVGDHVQFVPIEINEFEKLKGISFDQLKGGF